MADTTFAQRLRKAVRTVGIGIAPTAATADASVPTITSGSGAPSATEPAGSLYMRTGTGALYTTTGGGAWSANAAGSDFGATGLLADVVAESTAATGVTVDGLRIMDATIKPVAGGTAFVDLTAVATGEADVVLKDNLADALAVRESTNAYLTFTTTNDAERITTGKLLALPSQTIDMADAQVALVYGTAGAGEVKITGQLLLVDANSGTTEDLLLPPEATSTGVFLLICNTGGEDIVVKEDSDTTTICTISTTESAVVACDGTTWRGGVVKTT